MTNMIVDYRSKHEGAKLQLIPRSGSNGYINKVPRQPAVVVSNHWRDGGFRESGCARERTKQSLHRWQSGHAENSTIVLVGEGGRW